MAADGGGEKAPKTEDQYIMSINRRLNGLKRDLDGLAKIYYDRDDDVKAAAVTLLNATRYKLHGEALAAGVEHLGDVPKPRDGGR